MEQNTIIRTNKRENPYVMIDKYGLNDERLSWKAKGLLAYLLSKPDNWQIYERDLIKRSKDGRDAVRAGLRELEKYGYLSRRQLRDEAGHFTHMEYVIYERPIFDEIDDPEPADGKSVHGEEPLTENPSTDFPSTENPPLLNNDITKNELNMFDCLGASAETADAAEPDQIYETLADNIPKYCYVENAPLSQGYINEIFLMLVNQFPRQLDPNVVKIACKLYFERACEVRPSHGVITKLKIKNPVGFFRRCYEDAIKQYKVTRNRKAWRLATANNR